MRRFAVCFIFVCFLLFAGGAEACWKCGNPNHLFSPTNTFKPTNIFGPTFSPTLTFSPTNSIENGPVSASATVNNYGANGSGGGSGKIEGYLITSFLDPYTPIAADPMPYTGPYPEHSQFMNDQPEFQQTKWVTDEIDNLPNGGEITPVIRHKVNPVKYIQPRPLDVYLREVAKLGWWQKAKEDFSAGRITEEQLFAAKAEAEKDPSILFGYMWHGNVYCKSKNASDNPGTVWGGCSKKLRDNGCTYAFKIASIVSYGVSGNAKNQSGSVSLAGIFGSIFGFNAGAGAGNTDHDTAPYERVSTTWSCFGKPEPLEEKK